MSTRATLCRERFTTHGMSNTRINRIWRRINDRVNNPNWPQFHLYGGRGIKLLWESFEDFRDDMYVSYLQHVKKHGENNTTIERKNVNGHYSFGNCRWATRIEQANNKRNNRTFTFNGKTKTLAQWIEFMGLKKSTVKQRFYVYGWPIKRALQMK